MWASFTKDEKTLILSLLGLFVLGSGVSCFWRSNDELVFSATAPLNQGIVAQTTSTKQANTKLAPGLLADGRIDLNSASEEVIETLPGIGPSKAKLIVEYRQTNGGFRSVHDLDQVSGFGPATVTRLAQRVYVGAQAAGPTPPPRPTQTSTAAIFGHATPAPSPAPVMASAVTPAPRPAAIRHAAPQPSVARAQTATINTNRPVNINTASEAELATLKYIGEKLAQAIVQHRQIHGRFNTPASVIEVKGIGPRIYEVNRHRIVVR